VAHHTIKVRCSPLLVRHLDGLAEAHGGNRSAAIRSAVLAASLPEGTPPVPDRDECRRLLGELARQGSLPAIRALLLEYRRDPAARSPDDFDELDRLIARRRERRANGNGAGRRTP
jgi:hypothetical protein